MLSKDYGSTFYGKHPGKLLKEYNDSVEQHQEPTIQLSAWSARAAVKDHDIATANHRCQKVAEAIAAKLGQDDYEGLIAWLMCEVDMLEAINTPLAFSDEKAMQNMRRLIKRLAANGGYDGLAKEPDPNYHT
jgi:hypothetical protein